MSTPELDRKTALQEEQLRIQRQIAFASGLFQGDVTIRTLLESLAEGVVIIDNSGTILSVNTAAEQMFGYPEKELIGKPQAVLIPERFRKVHKEYEAHFFAEPRIRPPDQRLDLAGLRRDGSEFPVEISLNYIETINGVLALAFVSDITGRKKVEDALRFSEARYRTLFHDNPIMIVTLNADLTMLSVNPICASQLGYTIDELEGQSVLYLFHKDDRPAVAEQMRRCLQNPKQTNRWQFRKTHKDGGLLWVEETAQAVYDLDGELNLLVVCQDVTERKQAEDALRESEERFRVTFNQAAVGICHVAPDGHLLRINQKYCDLVGYTEEELKALTIKDITHPDDLDASMHHYQFLLEGKLENYSLEKRYIRKDGLTVWVNLTASMVFDAGGNPIFAVGVVEDITARKRAEEERERLLLQLEAVLESINEGVVISDLEGNVLTMNKEVLALYEYESSGQVCRPLSEYQDTIELFDLEGRPLPFEQWPTSRALRGERFVDWEVRVRCKDSGKLWIGNYSGTPARSKSGDIILSVITVRDVTERKQAEEALYHSEKRYRRLYNDTPVMLHSIDHDRRLVSVSNYWLETLGYERSEVLGRIFTEFLTEASCSYATEVVLPEFFRTGSNKEVPYQIIKKNGEILDVQLSAIAERDSEEKVVRSLAVMVDVTERKRAEEEIERLNVSLTARAADLEDANRELETFNYTVAHDLRNPLNVISSYCQVFMELCCDKLGEQCRRYIQETYDGTLRMNRLIEALLNFSRLAHAETHRETVDLSAMAHEVAAELKQAEPERRVQFLIAAGGSANVDADLLRVVLANLLGNAWKYTATREEGVIEFGTTEIDGKPAWFVRDNGNGFNMADAGKLFVPFQRLPGADECRGHGIGLATVEKVIKRHGGRVWAEGVPGKGACFYFTLSANEVTT